MTYNHQDLLSSLRIAVEAVELCTNKYLSTFNINSAYSFSSDPTDRKKYLHEYNIFSIELKNNIEKCEAQIAKLSLLICDADKSCNKDLTEMLVNKFNEYSEFVRALTKFVDSCETSFLNKNEEFRPHTIAQYTKQFVYITENYKKTI